MDGGHETRGKDYSSKIPFHATLTVTTFYRFFEHFYAVPHSLLFGRPLNKLISPPIVYRTILSYYFYFQLGAGKSKFSQYSRQS